MAVRIMFAEMDTRRAPREAQQDCTPRVLESLDTGFSLTAAVPRAPPTTSSPAPNLIGSAAMAYPLLQEQGCTEKNLAWAEDQGTGHERPQKIRGEVSHGVRRAREGVRREL